MKIELPPEELILLVNMAGRGVPPAAPIKPSADTVVAALSEFSRSGPPLAEALRALGLVEIWAQSARAAMRAAMPVESPTPPPAQEPTVNESGEPEGVEPAEPIGEPTEE